MIEARTIYSPTTGQANTPVPFTVDVRSRVVFIAPSAGETLTENDSFELRRVIEVDSNGDVVRSIKQYDKDGAILLGASRTQFEILSRGTYIVKKILDTTESVGAYQNYGIEEGV